jgi:LPXTG-motif cell wall-anchored protein
LEIGNQVAPNKSGEIMTSPDGTTWSLRSAPDTQRRHGIVWTNDIFVAVGSNSVITSGIFAAPTTTIPTTTTPASSPTTTVVSTVKKQDTLPVTGSTSSTLAIVAALLTAAGSVLVLRRPITH